MNLVNQRKDLEVLESQLTEVKDKVSSVLVAYSPYFEFNKTLGSYQNSVLRDNQQFRETQDLQKKLIKLAKKELQDRSGKAVVIVATSNPAFMRDVFRVPLEESELTLRLINF